jgi:glycosyltransferase involved in cell wall biosynthesis
MRSARLNILCLSQIPPSPPRFGAQRRMHGLWTALARHHDITAVSLLTPATDRSEVERAMSGYCREVVLVPVPSSRALAKRLGQLGALASSQSFERRTFDRPELRRTLRRVLSTCRFDVATVEFPFLANQRLDLAPDGAPPPLRVMDEHNIEFDLARQQATENRGLLRRLHNAANWPKVQREEVGAFRSFDGVTFCSSTDEQRARALVPSLRSAVVPNAVDIEEFRPSAELPPSDGCTVMFFGAINYFPNVDGLRYLLNEIWPRIERSHPRAKLKIVGQFPTPEIVSYQGPRIEVTGRVDDIRPHLSSAAVTVVPLRIGGGTRFKILEAMALARPVVSTSIGAEGIDARAGQDLLLADTPEHFSAAVGRVLDDRGLADDLGRRGRALVETRYSWSAAGQRLEAFLFELRERRAGAIPLRSPA